MQLFLVLVCRFVLTSVMALPRLSTVPQVAERNGISEWTVRREIKAGRLKARRIGRLVRVLDEDEARWMRGVSGEEQ
jgi:excisionase family DNA binding protein